MPRTPCPVIEPPSTGPIPEDDAGTRWHLLAHSDGRRLGRADDGEGPRGRPARLLRLAVGPRRPRETTAASHPASRSTSRPDGVGLVGRIGASAGIRDGDLLRPDRRKPLTTVPRGDGGRLIAGPLGSSQVTRHPLSETAPQLADGFAPGSMDFVPPQGLDTPRLEHGDAHGRIGTRRSHSAGGVPMLDRFAGSAGCGLVRATEPFAARCQSPSIPVNIAQRVAHPGAPPLWPNLFETPGMEGYRRNHRIPQPRRRFRCGRPLPPNADFLKDCIEGLRGNSSSFWTTRSWARSEVV